MKYQCKKIITVFLLILTSLISLVTAKKPTAIYHAFNMKYQDIIPLLENLANTGYSHLQISPAQASRTTIPHTYPNQNANIYDLWWLRYQPTDFLSLDNIYCNQNDLAQLINEARNYNIDIIADVVFNHVAALDGLERKEWDTSLNNQESYLTNLSRLEIYKNFSMHKGFERGLKENFLRGSQEAYDICMEDFHPWREHSNKIQTIPGSYWMSGALPSLKSSENVINIHKEHLRLLLDLGVKGFRFDAAKNIEPQALSEYINFINTFTHQEEKPYIYLEYLSGDQHKNLIFSEYAPITDFFFFKQLKKVFSFDGDLRDLRNIGYNTRNNVIFAENHDTAQNRLDQTTGVAFQISNQRDMELAITYTLARYGGVPLIFHENAQARDIPAGVKFRQIMKQDLQTNKPELPEYIYDIDEINAQNFMLMSRNDGNGIFILNKSNKEYLINLQEILRGLGIAKQRYSQIKDYRGNVTIHNNYPISSILVPPRSSLYFINAELIDETATHRITPITE